MAGVCFGNMHAQEGKSERRRITGIQAARMRDGADIFPRASREGSGCGLSVAKESRRCVLVFAMLAFCGEGGDAARMASGMLVAARDAHDAVHRVAKGRVAIVAGLMSLRGGARKESFPTQAGLDEDEYSDIKFSSSSPHDGAGEGGMSISSGGEGYGEDEENPFPIPRVIRLERQEAKAQELLQHAYDGGTKVAPPPDIEVVVGGGEGDAGGFAGRHEGVAEQGRRGKVRVPGYYEPGKLPKGWKLEMPKGEPDLEGGFHADDIPGTFPLMPDENVGRDSPPLSPLVAPAVHGGEYGIRPGPL